MKLKQLILFLIILIVVGYVCFSISQDEVTFDITKWAYASRGVYCAITFFIAFILVLRYFDQKNEK